ncbi:MAG: glycosyltransferase [Desulfovibrio sp.]|nr:glycosyltransferase [Desulfovibrio sp.]
MDCLTRLDATWTSGPVSPRPLRNFLFREGENDRRQLETLLKVPLGSLDGPTWLLEEQEIEPPALSDENAQAFVRTLPRDVAVSLLRRISNDKILLNPTQKCLRSALMATSAEFQTLGEPLPPVELTVLTMTYNHEAYIRQCMDSVLAQQTSFAVRHLILDHHSQDATAEIITAYAEQHPSIQPVLLSRRVYWENIRGLFMRCRTRYVALCDGDDYFTNPHKLQKQVDYLEQHRDCALCVHPVHVVFDDAPEKNYIFPNPALLSRGYRGKYPLTQLFKGNFIQTNTVVYRWRFTFGLPRWFRADLCPGDWYWHILHAELGKIGFLPEVMSAYRRHKQALYYQTHVSVKEHRKVYGLPELEFYKVVNEHFHGKYFDQLASLANGVLANFLQLSVEKDDETLLTTASKQYPEFVKFFLDSLKIVKDADGHTQAIVER